MLLLPNWSPLLSLSLFVFLLAQFWSHGVGICAVGTFGLCGNALAVAVLSSTDTNRSFNKLLIALAIVDSLVLINLMGENALLQTFLKKDPVWYRAAYPKILHPLKGMVQTAAIYMVVAVSAERYKAVVHPLR